ncbi:MAG: hypothetical protein WCL00_11030, partial [Bacteroidota bacterium]
MLSTDLIIDIGNTNTKLALFENGELQKISIFKEPSVQPIKDFLESGEEIKNCILSTVKEYLKSKGKHELEN